MEDRETEVLRGKKWPGATQHWGGDQGRGAGGQPRGMVEPADGNLTQGRSQISTFHPSSCGFFMRPHHALMTGAQLLGSYSRACYRGPNAWGMGKTGETGLGLGLEPASCSSFSPSLAPFHHCSFFPVDSKGWA